MSNAPLALPGQIEEIAKMPDGSARKLDLLIDLLGENACRRLGIYQIPPELLLSVVIPVYNERDTIARVVELVRAVNLPKEIIVVDDGSTDGTREILAGLEGGNLRVILHDRNRGKGAAVRTGFQHVRGSIVLIQDADLEYDPREYPSLIQPIVEGRADVVYGSRFIGETHRVLLFWHSVGNRFLTLLSNMLTNLNLTDMETGFKVFKAEVIQSLTLRSNQFEFEPEITAKIAKRGYRIYEMPISYAGRDYASGKKITWVDGIKALWAILKYRLLD